MAELLGITSLIFGFALVAGLSLAYRNIVKKIFFVANWNWVIYNFRRTLAHSVQEQGYEIGFVSPNGEHVDALQDESFRWIEWPLEGRSLNSLQELVAI